MADITNSKNERSNSPVLISDGAKFRYYGEEGDISLTEDEKDGITVKSELWKNPVLVYQNGFVHLYGEGGKLIMSCAASSGEPGETDPRKPDKGPIPPGKYILDPSEISKAGMGRKLDNLLFRDWGDYRVPLRPDGAETFGRKGFYLHGGDKVGTKGCIDVGNHDKELFPELMKFRKPITVIVR
jgi:hypothetical protein